jgi:hypothetical protein
MLLFKLYKLKVIISPLVGRFRWFCPARWYSLQKYRLRRLIIQLLIKGNGAELHVLQNNLD